MSDNNLAENTFGELAEMAGLLMRKLEENGFSHEEAVALASKVTVELVVTVVEGSFKENGKKKV